MNGISAAMKQTPESFLTSFSAMWRYNEKMAVYIPEAGPQQILTVLEPWSWTSASRALRNTFLLFISDSVYDISL